MRYVIIVPGELPAELAQILLEDGVFLPEDFALKQAVQHDRIDIHPEYNAAGERCVGADGDRCAMLRVFVE